MDHLIAVWIKFFFLLTPFFVLSVFLSVTAGWENVKRNRLSLKVIVAVLAVCLVLFFFGTPLFNLLGITLDSFRIGAGTLLFLTAISLMRGVDMGAEVQPTGTGTDIAVVPLAIPITVGPGTTGALLVMGAENVELTQKISGCAGLVLAVLSLMVMMLAAGWLERVLGKQGIGILSKLTGFFLSAMAAQMIFTGIRGFFPSSGA